jgi:hypothetical protein
MKAFLISTAVTFVVGSAVSALGYVTYRKRIFAQIDDAVKQAKAATVG